jgi:hypothetical protein
VAFLFRKTEGREKKQVLKPNSPINNLLFAITSENSNEEYHPKAEGHKGSQASSSRMDANNSKRTSRANRKELASNVEYAHRMLFGLANEQHPEPPSRSPLML